MTQPRPTVPANPVSPRETHAKALTHARSTPPQPYTDGEHVLRVVTISGRITGTPQVLPIAVTQINGRRYLCSPNRQRDWARNLAASGQCHIEHDDPGDYRAVRVDGEEATTALHTYLSNVVRLRGTEGPNMWPFAKDAPADEIRLHVDQVSVFRLTAVADTTPPGGE